MKSDITLKVIITGELDTGKTILVNNLDENIKTSNKFDNNSHIGMSFYNKKLECGDLKINLHLWKGCGQKSYAYYIKEYYYKDTICNIICYNASDVFTFYKVNDWIEYYIEKKGLDIPIYILGFNKNDNNIISESQINLLMKKYQHCKYLYHRQINFENKTEINDFYNEMIYNIIGIFRNKRNLPGIIIHENSNKQILNNIHTTTKKNKICCIL